MLTLEKLVAAENSLPPPPPNSLLYPNPSSSFLLSFSSYKSLLLTYFSRFTLNLTLLSSMSVLTILAAFFALSRTPPSTDSDKPSLLHSLAAATKWFPEVKNLTARIWFSGEGEYWRRSVEAWRRDERVDLSSMYSTNSSIMSSFSSTSSQSSKYVMTPSQSPSILAISTALSNFFKPRRREIAARGNPSLTCFSAIISMTIPLSGRSGYNSNPTLCKPCVSHILTTSFTPPPASLRCLTALSHLFSLTSTLYFPIAPSRASSSPSSLK
mmetsp:Transcript_2036/g.4101  ORF Transcript_2036/g.4101 Transcript_2036/m.4101 type:complete len:269 (-) Transcript_2036:1243-2049(-)